MRIFDLHCDMIPACLEQGYDLAENEGQLDLKRGSSFERWIQTFAFWVDDSYRGEDVWKKFCSQYQLFLNFCRKNPDRLHYLNSFAEVIPFSCNAVLAVENGAVLGGKLERIALLKSYGISFFSLTWNGKNEIGSGAGMNGGLTEFGKAAVRELEKENMIIDVSHLNEDGFYDLERMATRPFVATHSNARAVCEHPRNLTNEQIKIIAERGGLIGLNFYAPFVGGGKTYSFSELFSHIEQMIRFGGEDVLALGSDFGVTPMPEILSEIKKLENLQESMIKYFGKELTEKVFYQNAESFFGRNIIIEEKRKNVL